MKFIRAYYFPYQIFSQGEKERKQILFRDPHFYIYTLQNGKPKLIWGFATGARAEGGLKKIYYENGEFVTETFGDDKFKDGKWEFGYPKNNFRGDCCPTAYTKTRFKWDGKKFTVQGSPKVFDYDDNNRNGQK